jgi:hypothetical protein
MSVPTYAYALNNPLYWIDPNGLDVTNNSPDPVVVKPENGPWFVLPPNRKWEGSPDGVDCHYSKKQLAVPGKDWMPKNDIVIDKSGTPRCTGGPCRFLPSKAWPNTTDHPDWAWDNSSLGPTPPVSFP